MAFLPPWSWLLAACLSVSSAGALNSSDLYPPLWEESPGQIGDYKVEDGKYIVDPWVFTERMGMYKILVQETAPYFAKFGPDNEQNILWGLPLQHGWQYISGRLVDPSRRTNCGYGADLLCISVDSWWADINYFLSVIPFLAAVDTGIVGISSAQVTLLPPTKDQSRFCYDVAGCRSSFPETMSKWNAFYQHLKEPSRSFNDLLKHLWDAHTTSLKNSLGSFEDRFIHYSNQEVDFGKSWSVTVEYFAASSFPTTLMRSRMFQMGLPPRILLSSDVAPLISDFTKLQNIVLVYLQKIYDLNESTGSFSLTVWKILMETETVRKKVVESLQLFFELFS